MYQIFFPQSLRIRLSDESLAPKVVHLIEIYNKLRAFFAVSLENLSSAAAGVASSMRAAEDNAATRRNTLNHVPRVRVMPPSRPSVMPPNVSVDWHLKRKSCR